MVLRFGNQPDSAVSLSHSGRGNIAFFDGHATNLTDFNVKLYAINGTLVKEYYKSDKVESLYLPKGFYIQKPFSDVNIY